MGKGSVESGGGGTSWSEGAAAHVGLWRGGSGFLDQASGGSAVKWCRFLIWGLLRRMW